MRLAATFGGKDYYVDWDSDVPPTQDQLSAIARQVKLQSSGEKQGAGGIQSLLGELGRQYGYQAPVDQPKAVKRANNMAPLPDKIRGLAEAIASGHPEPQIAKKKAQSLLDIAAQPKTPQSGWYSPSQARGYEASKQAAIEATTPQPSDMAFIRQGIQDKAAQFTEVANSAISTLNPMGSIPVVGPAISGVQRGVASLLNPYGLAEMGGQVGDAIQAGPQEAIRQVGEMVTPIMKGILQPTSIENFAESATQGFLLLEGARHLPSQVASKIAGIKKALSTPKAVAMLEQAKATVPGFEIPDIPKTEPKATPQTDWDAHETQIRTQLEKIYDKDHAANLASLMRTVDENQANQYGVAPKPVEFVKGEKPQAKSKGRETSKTEVPIPAPESPAVKPDAKAKAESGLPTWDERSNLKTKGEIIAQMKADVIQYGRSDAIKQHFLAQFDQDFATKSDALVKAYAKGFYDQVLPVVSSPVIDIPVGEMTLRQKTRAIFGNRRIESNDDALQFAAQVGSAYARDGVPLKDASNEAWGVLAEQLAKGEGKKFSVNARDAVAEVRAQYESHARAKAPESPQTPKAAEPVAPDVAENVAAKDPTQPTKEVKPNGQEVQNQAASGRQEGVLKSTQGFDFTEERMNPSELKVDPYYQFKRSEVTDQANQVSEQLKGAKSYDQATAGPLTVYERTDGSRYVVNGHHRRELAIRTKAESVPVRVIRESSGVTPEMARGYGALQNIMDGKGTALDAASVLKDLGYTESHLSELGVSTRSSLARDAIGLTKLSDNALEYVQNNRVSEPVGAAIGDANLSPAHQVAAMREAMRAELTTRQQGQMLASELSTKKPVVMDSGDLFGGSDEFVAFGEHVKLMDAVMKRLVRNERLFEQMNSARATGATVVDRNSQTAAAQMERFARQVIKSDPELSDFIGQKAGEYAKDPSKFKKVTDEIYQRTIESAQRRKDELFGTGHGSKESAPRTEGVQPREQGLFQQNNAKVTIGPDKAVVTILKDKPDASQAVHEMAHVWRRQAFEGKTETALADQNVLNEWVGAKAGNWTTAHEERFARGFERYLTTGKAPNNAIKPVFERIKGWMQQVYRNISRSPIKAEVPDHITEVFDRWLGGKEDIPSEGVGKPKVSEVSPPKESILDQGTFSNADADRLADEFGWDKKTATPEKITEWRDEAQKINRNPIDLAAEIVRDKRVAKPQEEIFLRERLSFIRDELRKARQENADPMSVMPLVDEAQSIYDAVKESGSAWGRAGVGRQLIVQTQYEGFAMKARAVSANLGEPLSEKASAALNERIKALETTNDALETELEAAKAHIQKLLDQLGDKKSGGKMTTAQRRNNALASLKRLGVQVAEFDGDTTTLYQKAPKFFSDLPKGHTERIAVAVKQLVRTYADEGIHEWEPLMERLKKDVPGIGEEEALWILSDKYRTAKINSDIERIKANRYLAEVKRDAIYRNKSLIGKAMEHALDVANTTQRSLQTTLDDSLALIQGKNVLVWKPDIWFRSVGKSLVALAKKDPLAWADNEMVKMQNDPMYPAMVKAKLGLVDTYGPMYRQEESFAGRLENHIPGLSHSKAMATVLANKMRFELFKRLAKGREPSAELYADIARQINIATGRGHGVVAERLGGVGAGLVSYAPRYYLSKFQHNLGVPLLKAQTKAGRIAALEMYAKQAVGYYALAKAIQLFGGDVDTDSRSTAYGTATIGDRTYDVFKTQLEPVKFFSQLLFGRISQSGNYTPNNAFGATTWEDYIRTHESPLLRSAEMWVTNKTYDNTTGKQRDVKMSDYWMNFIPMSIREMMQTQDPATWPASFFGANVGNAKPKSKNAPPLDFNSVLPGLKGITDPESWKP